MNVTKKFIVFNSPQVRDGEHIIHLEHGVFGTDVSDGYHTMDELYDHRLALTVALFRLLEEFYRKFGIYRVFKTYRHHDGSMFDGYFMVMSCRKDGSDQMSYHYKLEHWDKFQIQVQDISPYPYDGHTSKDVIERLMKL